MADTQESAIKRFKERFHGHDAMPIRVPTHLKVFENTMLQGSGPPPASGGHAVNMENVNVTHFNTKIDSPIGKVGNVADDDDEGAEEGGVALALSSDSKVIIDNIVKQCSIACDKELKLRKYVDPSKESDDNISEFLKYMGAKKSMSKRVVLFVPIPVHEKGHMGDKTGVLKAVADALFVSMMGEFKDWPKSGSELLEQLATYHLNTHVAPEIRLTAKVYPIQLVDAACEVFKCKICALTDDTGFNVYRPRDNSVSSGAVFAVVKSTGGVWHGTRILPESHFDVLMSTVTPTQNATSSNTVAIRNSERLMHSASAGSEAEKRSLTAESRGVGQAPHKRIRKETQPGSSNNKLQEAVAVAPCGSSPSARLATLTVKTGSIHDVVDDVADDYDNDQNGDDGDDDDEEAVQNALREANTKLFEDEILKNFAAANECDFVHICNQSSTTDPGLRLGYTLLNKQLTQVKSKRVCSLLVPNGSSISPDCFFEAFTTGVNATKTELSKTVKQVVGKVVEFRCEHEWRALNNKQFRDLSLFAKHPNLNTCVNRQDFLDILGDHGYAGKWVVGDVVDDGWIRATVAACDFSIRINSTNGTHKTFSLNPPSPNIVELGVVSRDNQDIYVTMVRDVNMLMK